MRIEVAYARPERQLVLSVELGAGASVEQAIVASGILQHFPEINLNDNAVGLFGKVCALQHALSEGDRVEIYRPLRIDPKEARRNRAAQAQKGR